MRQLWQMPVRQLSLGQRMRCEIAASLLHSPKLLFLDEPTIGLDAVSKLAVRSFIKKLNKEQGVTVILTTHDMSDIEALANRILMIGKGSLLYDGSLEELKGRFGSGKTVTVDYRGESGPVDIPGAAMLEWSAERAVYSFDPEQMTLAEIVSRLSASVEVVDIEVVAKDIDEMIVRLYEEHKI